ncbi:ANTAR domain-containing response regulator [Nonomuraea rubra]|uniref:ANTAR domain-containing response regulator n=1 Tax=Nonomuraea rubra TaxID=46180 RepID=UPI00361ECDC6
MPNCSGASAEHWRDHRVIVSGSHSELIMLVEGERELGRAPPSRPGRAAAAPPSRTCSRRPAGPATTRWPPAGACAPCSSCPSRCRPRCSSSASTPYGPAPSPPGAGSLADMLTEQVGVAMANMWEFEEVRTDHAQLQEALAGRSVIDQAKGIIMQTSGCTAEAAFEELRRISQHHQVKVADLARLLVDEHQRKSARP